MSNINLNTGQIHIWEIPENTMSPQEIQKTLLSGYLNIKPAEVKIGRQAKGKPYSIDDPALFFNMSNSGNKTVFAFTRDSELGVDIELIRKLHDLDQMIEVNFTSNEIQFINNNKEDRLKRFFKFWTVKEAYLKAIGEGMRLPPDNLEFTVEKNEFKFQSARGIFESNQWIFKNLDIENDYVGTLAIKNNGIHQEIKYFQFEHFY